MSKELKNHQEALSELMKKPNSDNYTLEEKEFLYKEYLHKFHDHLELECSEYIRKSVKKTKTSL